MASKTKPLTVGRQTRLEHDRHGCDCRQERGCVYRRGRLRADEERCPSCGYVSMDGTLGQVGHDNMCDEPGYPDSPSIEDERSVEATLLDREVGL